MEEVELNRSDVVRHNFQMEEEEDTDHVERKVPKCETHKLRERKVKTLTRN
jgi:hypothetical protein